MNTGSAVHPERPTVTALTAATARAEARSSDLSAALWVAR
jgi:hypothetical protein